MLCETMLCAQPLAASRARAVHGAHTAADAAAAAATAAAAVARARQASLLVPGSTVTKTPAAAARGGRHCGQEWPPRSGLLSGRTREGEAARAHRTCERREAGGLQPVGDGGLGQLLRLRGGGHLRAQERRAEVSAVATDGGCHCQVAERACADVFEVSGRVTDAREKARHTGRSGKRRAPSCSSARCRRGLRANPR